MNGTVQVNLRSDYLLYKTVGPDPHCHCTRRVVHVPGPGTSLYKTFGPHPHCHCTRRVLTRAGTRASLYKTFKPDPHCHRTRRVGHVHGSGVY